MPDLLIRYPHSHPASTQRFGERFPRLRPIWNLAGGDWRACHPEEFMIISVPGPVNLIGEHIDYHNLPVLPMAIQRRVSVEFEPREDCIVNEIYPTFDLVTCAFHAGALGARLTGAGFGGCAIVLCKASDVHKVRTGLQEEFYARHSDFDPANHLIVAEPSAGALSA